MPWSCCLRYKPYPLEVGVDNFIPIGFFLLQCWSRCGHAGVVDDNLDWTEARFSGVQCGLDARCDGDVHHHALDLSLGRGDVIDSFGQRFRAARANGYASSLRRKKGRKKSSKTA